jgi:type I restriction enzyme S subunit
MNKNNIVDIIDVEPRHYQTIKETLARFLPYKKVIAYGSRVKWNASETSDLDLAVLNATDKQIYAAKEAFDESNIPFIIQLLNWDTIPQDFKENIEQKYHILQKEDDWGIFRLGEVADKIGDGLHGTPKYNIDGKYYFINGNNLKNGKITITNNTKNVDRVEFDKYKKELNSRTILLSINGTIGNLAKYNNELCILGESAAYLNIKKDVDKGFIYYVMFDKSFQNEISYNANGSTIKNVSLAQLRNYQFYLPPLQEQKAIAEILSSLDDKIDLLHRQNKTLESLAETLFRHYFIDNLSSTSSPSTRSPSTRSGKAVDSDSSSLSLSKGYCQTGLRQAQPPIQKRLPEPVEGILSKGIAKSDWEEGKLGDICTISGGYAFKSKDFTESGVPIVKIKNISNNKVDILDGQFLSNILADKIDKKYKLFDGDIVMAMTGATIGKVGLICSSDYDFLLLNQRVAVLRSEYQALLWFLLNAINLEDDILNLSNGAAQANISTFGIEEVSAPKITEEQAEKFNEEAKPMFDKILFNTKQIQTLEKLRDTLLPKLISGAIRINYEQ